LQEFKKTELFLMIKNPKNLFIIFLIWFLITYFLIYKIADYFQPNLKDFKLYLFLILTILISIQIFCIIYMLKSIIKIKKRIISSMLIILLPFTKVCILGACGLLLPSFIMTILPFFIVNFILEYLTVILIFLIIANIFSLKMLGCFNKRNLYEFKINKQKIINKT
jgi:hypothetical protein